MGPDMAPPNPQRSARPGAAVTRLDHALLDGAPTWPPNPRTFEAARHSRAASLSARISVEHGGPDMAPQTPERSARPGAAVTRLDHAVLDRPRQCPPNPPTLRPARRSRAAPPSRRTPGAPARPPPPPPPPHRPAWPWPPPAPPHTPV